MGARASSQNNDKSIKKPSQTVVQSDVESIAALVLKLSQDVCKSKKMLNEIDTSEDIGQKIQELQNQFDQIKHDIDRIVKNIKELQKRLVHAGPTQNVLLKDFADLVKSLSSLDAENKNLVRKTDELRKRAQRLQTDVSEK